YAFTDSPPSVSSSSIVTLGRLFTRIMPNTTEGAVSAGEKVNLSVQLMDRYGETVRRAGTAIALGQAEYTPTGLFAGEAIVNGGPIGASPTIAYTDDTGIAHFSVESARATGREVFFQAWVAEGSPQGYSKQLAIWFDG